MRRALDVHLPRDRLSILLKRERCFFLFHIRESRSNFGFREGSHRGLSPLFDRSSSASQNRDTTRTANRAYRATCRAKILPSSICRTPSILFAFIADCASNRIARFSRRFKNTFGGQGTYRKRTGSVLGFHPSRIRIAIR